MKDNEVRDNKSIPMNKIIDISMDLNEKTIVWIQDDAPELRPILRMPKDPCNFTWLNFGAHAGTHIDAPFYLYLDKWASDKVPFDRLIGRCQVIDLTNVEDTITVADLKRMVISSKIVLLKTMNSYDEMLRYNPKHVALSADAAEYLVSKGITTIGYDYQSFEREGKNVLHQIFMSNDIICIDNLRLRDAMQGEYTLICLPIKITGIDAAPSRAILISD